MRKKKALLVSLITLLFLSIAMVSADVPPLPEPLESAYPAQAIYVWPTRGAYELYATFTVDVMVNVTDPDPLNSPPDGLFGFEYKLMWDATIIEVTNYTVNIPAVWGKHFTPIDRVDDYNATHKYHWLSVLALADPTTSSFTGVTSLCTYTLHVTDIGSCALDLQDTKLADDNGDPIAHSEEDGFFTFGNPVAIFTYSPDRPLVNETITFSASASYDHDGSIVSYDWDLGDGTNGTGMMLSHTYTAEGSYNVTLIVTDDDGLTGTFSKLIKVKEYSSAQFPLVNVAIVILIAIAVFLVVVYYLRKRSS